MMMFGWTTMLVYAVFWVLILVGLGFLVYALLARWMAQGQSSTDDPLSLLTARYARGDITREEFLDMRRDLGDTEDSCR